jgi:hypothetical protein
LNLGTSGRTMGIDRSRSPIKGFGSHPVLDPIAVNSRRNREWNKLASSARER